MRWGAAPAGGGAAGATLRWPLAAAGPAVAQYLRDMGCLTALLERCGGGPPDAMGRLAIRLSALSSFGAVSGRLHCSS